MRKPTASAHECRVAVVTPPGQGGIGVIRLAGRGALSLAQAMFRGKRSVDLARSAGKLHYGHLVKGEEVLDEVLVAVISADPEEQTVDINCHGGIVAVERVMGELEDRGARRVGAGAITQQRLDAVQREAAAAIPRARSRLAVRMLLEQYNGELSRAVRAIAAMAPRRAASGLARLEGGARLGAALAAPRRVVIAGSPNAGKSTLFNMLLGRSRAIVTEIPGTTRDFISDVVVIRGVPFELVDTAGMRDTGHIIEREGVRFSREQISAADVVVLVFDAARPLDAEDEQLFAELADAAAPVLVAANKIDLLDGGGPRRPFSADVRISAEKGTGIKDLEARIVEAAVGAATYCGGPAIFTARQLALIAAAHERAARGDEEFRQFLRGVTSSPQASS